MRRFQKVSAIYKLHKGIFQSRYYSTAGAATTKLEDLKPITTQQTIDSADHVTKSGTEAGPDIFSEQVSDAQASPVSFDNVPGPVILKYISTIWTYVPIIGNQLTANTIQYLLSAGSQLSWGDNMWLFKYLLDEYGPVVRLHGPFGGNVVILSRPEHASVVFKNEGPYPIRSSLDCLEKYRLDYRHYKQAGPFVMYGPDWEKLRKSIEIPLKQSLIDQFEKIEWSCDEFITRIQMVRNRQHEVPATFREEIKKWSLECLCSIMFHKKMGFLDPQGLSPESETNTLLEHLNSATDAIRKCEVGLHLWKFLETPAWKKLVKHLGEIETILQRHIRMAQDSLRKRKTENRLSDISLIECFLLRDAMLSEDVLTIMLDMLILGVNMTTHTVGFLMYHLARNPRAQHKLFEEISQQPMDINAIELKALPYLRACLRESLRLKPPMPVLSRVTTKDISLHGYQIPRGTYLLMATNLSSLREEHFEDALKFKPERWQGFEFNQDMEALATIPFGHGAKACVARELAEVQICLLMSKIMRKYRIEYHYGDITSNNRLLAMPQRPLRFRFVNRC